MVIKNGENQWTLYCFDWNDLISVWIHYFENQYHSNLLNNGSKQTAEQYEMSKSNYIFNSHSMNV